MRKWQIDFNDSAIHYGASLNAKKFIECGADVFAKDAQSWIKIYFPLFLRNELIFNYW